MTKRSPNRNERWETKTLKALIIVYIFLCLVIAGLNYGLPSSASPTTQELVTKLWHFYENQFKTVLIITGSILTLRIAGRRAKEQRKNLIGFVCAALVVHIVGPILLHSGDLYFFSMPLPWSTTALQLATDQSVFYQSHLPLWGAAGISAILVFYGVYSAIVYGGTILLGRRWQCSTLCLFNGFISESFSPAFPVLGKKRALSGRKRTVFAFAKWTMLSVSVLITSFWLYAVFFEVNRRAASLIGTIEIAKYLSLELLVAMLLWLVFSGRGYCYYCPMGTVLGWISRLAGQKIRTDRTQCVNCRKCDTVCPMGIEISVSAMDGKDVTDSRCVGCRHCVDSCRVGTLEYTTRFLGLFQGHKK